MKKISLTQLKKHLRQKTHNELVEEISHLYKNFAYVKEHYQASFFNDDAGVLEKYKQIVLDEFSSCGRPCFPKMRASVARKAISDYKKIACSDSNIAEIMLTYVEAGVDCTNTYGDIDEAFYISMETMYENTLKFITEKNVFSDFENRLQDVVDNTSGIGWGFHDQLSSVYEDYQEKAYQKKSSD